MPGLSQLLVVPFGESSHDATLPPHLAGRITVGSVLEFFRWDSR